MPSPTPSAVRRAAAAFIAAAVIAAAVIAYLVNNDTDGQSSTKPAEGTSAAGALFAAPGGSGTSCTAAAACSLAAAVAQAKDTQTITLLAGNYGDMLLTGPTHKQAVTIEASSEHPGARFTGDIKIKAPDLSWQGITAVGANIKLYGDRNTFDHLTLTGTTGRGTLFIRANHDTITNSDIGGGTAHDGIDLAATSGDYATKMPAGCGPASAKECATVNTGTVISHSVIHDLADTPGTSVHVDCIQLYDTADVTINDNRIYNCANGGIQTSPGQRHGIYGLTITNNTITGAQGASADLRTIAIDGLTFDHNTLGTGALRFPLHSSGTVRSAAWNIVGYLSVARPCTTSLTDSLVARYPNGLDCTHVPGPTLTSTGGNVLAPLPAFIDAKRGNLKLKGKLPASAPKDPEGKPVGAV